MSAGQSFSGTEPRLFQAKATTTTDVYTLKQSELKSWTMFRRRASLTYSNARELKDVAKSVANGDLGLPQLKVLDPPSPCL